MAALNIDFAHPRPRHPRLAWGVLALGAAGLALALLDYQAARAQHRLAEASLAQVRAVPRARTVAAAAAPTPEAQRATERARAALVRPWGAVWRELENTLTGDVALLGIDASAARLDTRLTAEATGMEPAVAYVEALRASPRVRSAQLTHHERREVEGQPLLRFTVEVRWEGVAP